MSSSSNEVKESIKRDASPSVLQNDYVQSLVKIGTTSVFVSSLLYPLKYIQTNRQVGLSTNFRPRTYSLNSLLPVLYGLGSVQKAGLARNSVTANRDLVSNQVDSVIGSQGGEPSQFKKLQGLLMTTAVIAG